MNFKKIVVGGIQYGDQQDLSNDQVKKNFPKVNNVSFKDSRFFRANDQKIQEYLRVLYLCHDIIVNKSTNNDGFAYSSSSPDEIAFINFAKMCGY